ncbi:hypothetical protein [Fulvivirga lutea]|uniref:Uncharacterized protein n=1 Tax=Fulvivirga lutea TaxID=2810512 RepID=A0A975A2B3_9BACT|nr:hypothetical protein [Fulvivirga lutea]QSE98651.1 hypothetical protein JR347_06115 [Fulvivirga lutea]
MRDKIWNNYQNSVFKSFLLDEMINAYQKWERNLNVFLAIMSSGSIGAWAVWKELPMVWGGLIALSNVINVVRPYFPYSKYLKEVREKKNAAAAIVLGFEKLWFNYEQGNLSEEQASNEFFQLKNEFAKAYNFDQDMGLQNSESINAKAELKTQNYTKLNYNI